jgi:hypothetical protein
VVISRLQVADVRPGLMVTLRVDPQNEQKIAIESFGIAGGVTYTQNEYEDDLQPNSRDRSIMKIKKFYCPAFLQKQKLSVITT